MRALLRFLLRLLYRFRCCNEAILDTPGPLLLVANHVSWWDWLLLGVCLEPDWRFVVPTQSGEASWIARRVLGRRALAVDLHSSFAVKRLTEYLDNGGRLMWFPEGRLSRTGSLMKFFDGTGLLLSRTRARLIIAYIRGAERLPFSPNPSRKRWFPRLTIRFSQLLTPPRDQDHTPESRSRLSDWLRAQMLRQQFETELELSPATLPAAIRAAAGHRLGRVVLQDSTLRPLSYRRLLVGAELLSGCWKTSLRDARVGLLLPNVNALPLTLLSVWAANKIPAILNYSLGPASLLACMRLAGVSQIITSRAFVAHLKLELEPFRREGVQFLFLEDARESISAWDRLRASARALLRRPRVQGCWQPSDIAVILFTSGSESEPKGVELSHRNLLANIWQMVSVIDLLETDRFFNALPLFHSFGLTVGLLLPLVRGVFVFLYVSPLHFRIVPAAFYNLDCTVLFGTNSFLAGYARKAHPYDFHRLRYVFAGAEKLQEMTVNVWMRKFGVRILEGYGATECSPCVSVNLPSHPQPGSVGQLLPGIDYRLEPVEGLASNGSNGEGRVGRLFVRGPNIMRGYVNADANARFQSLGGWYDTGDVIQVDAGGTLYVLGRLKRFAKVSGEMVSLAAVEDALAAGFAQFGLKFGIAILTRPDEVRGERLIAVTNEPAVTLEAVRETMRSRGFSNLAVPREVRLVTELPRLGTGKINLRELERMVAD
jgi:acyl-[acyl-carrier-protein]-phospholipid O-acyltransferase/long-chain-fatty-acid--[acyl-carrier-protein] ligase